MPWLDFSFTADVSHRPFVVLRSVVLGVGLPPNRNQKLEAGPSLSTTDTSHVLQTLQFMGAIALAKTW